MSAELGLHAFSGQFSALFGLGNAYLVTAQCGDRTKTRRCESGFVCAVGKVARDLGLVAPGCRILANHGADARQEVPHFHVHIFGGKDLGRMIKPADK